MGAACCTVRLTVSHMKKKEEAGICWTGDVECRRRGYAGEGCGMRKEVEVGIPEEIPRERAQETVQ